MPRLNQLEAMKAGTAADALVGNDALLEMMRNRQLQAQVGTGSSFLGAIKDTVGDVAGPVVGAGLKLLGASGQGGLRALSGLTGGGFGHQVNARDALGLDPEAGGRVAGGFDTVLSALVDPLTYVGVGAVNRGAKGVAAVGKALAPSAGKEALGAGAKRLALAAGEQAPKALGPGLKGALTTERTAGALGSGIREAVAPIARPLELSSGIKGALGAGPERLALGAGERVFAVGGEGAEVAAGKVLPKGISEPGRLSYFGPGEAFKRPVGADVVPWAQKWERVFPGVPTPPPGTEWERVMSVADDLVSGPTRPFKGAPYTGPRRIGTLGGRAAEDTVDDAAARMAAAAAQAEARERVVAAAISESTVVRGAKAAAEASADANTTLAFKFMGKAIPGTETAARFTDKAVLNPLRTAPGVRQIRRFFVPGSRLANAAGSNTARNVGLNALNARDASEALGRIGVDDKINTLRNMLPEEKFATVSNAMENPAARATLDAEEEVAYNGLVKIQAEADNALLEAGIDPKFLRDSDTYFRHVLTDELKDLETVGAKAGIPGLRKRTLEGTVEEINADAGYQIFKTDPFIAVTSQHRTAMRIAANQKMLQQLIDHPQFLDKTGGSLIRAAKQAPGPGWKKVSHDLSTSNLWAPDDVADNLARIARYTPNSAEGRELLSWIDNATSFIKRTTQFNVATGAGTIVRNATSDILMIAADNPAHLVQFPNGKLVATAIGKIPRGVYSESDDAIVLALKAEGLSDELAEDGLAMLRQGTVSPARFTLQEVGGEGGRSAINRAINPEKFTDANSYLTNVARATLFLGKKAQGMGAAAAHRDVQRLLFDYSRAGATEFENEVMKRMMFYVYARNIVGAVARTTARRPGVAAAMQRAGVGLPNPEEEREGVPSWALGMTAVDIPLLGKLVAGFDTPGQSAIQTIGQVTQPGGKYDNPVPEALFGPVPGALGVLMGGGRPDRGGLENFARESFTPLDIAMRLQEKLTDDQMRDPQILKLLTGLRTSPLETPEQRLGRLKGVSIEQAKKERAASGEPKRPAKLSNADLERILRAEGS